MTRDEIYEHLAKVYLGKREGVSTQELIKKKQTNHSWLVINVVITAVIVISTMYGFTAFLTRKAGLQSQVFYSLNNNPVRMAYDLNPPFPSTKTFSITIPAKDASKYTKLNLSIRGMNGAYPGIVKLIITNLKNEKATHYIQNVGSDWQKVSIPFEKLNLTDWTNVQEVAFVLEAWNMDHRKGTVLIDDISFSN
jgi:hypothetical protein